MTSPVRTTLAVLVLSLAVGCVRGPPPPPLTGGPTLLNRSGEPLEFTLKRYPSDEPFTLSSARGSVVLLDVWATWCEPCEDAFPLYGAMLEKYKARGLQVFAISVDADPRQLEPFLTRTQSQLPILLDPEAAFAESRLRVSMMPTTFLLDRKGVVRHVHEGFVEEHMAKMTAQLEALLAEPQ
jgi:cytochrome c biogenesis protein CcmG, thiol:disulfide interchange protein DsbE